MRSVTGIELGADSCVIARVRPGRETVRVSAMHGLYEGDWDTERTLSQSLRDVRRSKKFPRRARVVAWGLQNNADDLSTKAAVASLTEAGFVVDAVMSPPEALLRLAQQRPRAAGREDAAWLSLNRHGAAIALVHNGELLYSREFDWHYRSATTVKGELLQRYSLVAILASELRHGFSVVRAEQGVTIGAVVTCGDLPDLRSLTMPLIEELDIEVETLDTLEGLTADSPARPEDIAEKAPAMRLACAVAATKVAAARPLVWRWAAAAALVLIALVVWAARESGRWIGTARPETPGQIATRIGAERETAAGPRAPRDIQRSPAASPGVTAEPTAGVGRASDRPQSPSSNVPAATTGRRDPVSGVIDSGPAARRGAPERAPEPSSGERLTGELPRASRRSGVKPVQAGIVRPTLVPLKDPLPVVNSILVAPDRRLAVVDGEIVREGEHVGRRILIRIEPAALILREPSGYEVRVPIRRKLGGAS